MQVKNKLVEVYWNDAASNKESDWISIKRTLDVTETYTVGYIIGNHKKRIVLAQSISNEGKKDACMCNLFAIPKGCIKKIKKLK